MFHHILPREIRDTTKELKDKGMEGRASLVLGYGHLGLEEYEKSKKYLEAARGLLKEERMDFLEQAINL